MKVITTCVVNFAFSNMIIALSTSVKTFLLTKANLFVIMLPKEGEAMNERIKLIRTNSKLTMKEFADRIGTTVTSISRYESGERLPSKAVSVAISKEFNVNYDWLMTGEGPMMDPMLDDDAARTAKVVNWYESLSDRLKDEVEVLASMDKEWWKTLEKGFEELDKRKKQK